jgi:hypothetical protein
MADNVTLPVTGTGDATPVIAADEVGGVKIQRVKIVEGADGVNDGDISAANPLPVVLPSTQVTSLNPSGNDYVNGTLPALAVVALVNYDGAFWVVPESFTRGEGDDGQRISGAGSLLWDGAVTRRERTPNVFKPQSAVLITTETTIWTPASGKKFRLMGYHLVCSVAGNIVLKDNTAGTTILVIPSAAGDGGTFVMLGNGILSAAANNVLTATGPATGTLSGFVFGTEE